MVANISWPVPPLSIHSTAAQDRFLCVSVAPGSAFAKKRSLLQIFSASMSFRERFSIGRSRSCFVGSEQDRRSVPLPPIAANGTSLSAEFFESPPGHSEQDRQSPMENYRHAKEDRPL